MKIKPHSQKTFFLIVIILMMMTPVIKGQSVGDPAFNKDLREYVNTLFKRYQGESIDNERFLVQQIRMVNAEMKERVGNVTKFRKKYFSRLETQLAEVRALKGRLAGMGSSTLNQFADQVEQQIKDAIDSGVIDYERQKAIEEAVQLLHIAEDMIQRDPGAKLNSNPKLMSGIAKTGKKLNQNVSSAGYGAGGKSVSVYDLYKEWKLNDRIKYDLRWTDVQVLKNRMLKNATSIDRNRMLAREIKEAALAYNYGFYDLAERSFGEIIKRYKDLQSYDDLLFYKAKANYMLGRYNQAKEDYELLISKFSSLSLYTPAAYSQLVYIAYHFEKYKEALSIYETMKSQVSTTDPNLEFAGFIAIVSAYRSQMYEKVVEYALEMSPGSAYYNESRYVLAETYAAMGDLEQSITTFQQLIKDGMDPDFRSTLYLKIAYLNYELGNYYNAIRNFDEIPGDYSRYDRVIMGYAWTYFSIEMDKDVDKQRDFSIAKEYLAKLLRNYYFSDYYLEANTLLGYIYQTEEKPDDALRRYEYSYDAKTRKLVSDKMNTELRQVKKAYRTADYLEKKALREKNISAYYKAKDIKKKLQKPLYKLTYTDISSAGLSSQKEVMRFKRQIDELERLKKLAHEQEDKAALKKIEILEEKIYYAVSLMPDDQPTTTFGLNYFDDQPLARKASVLESENESIKQMRLEAAKERQLLLKKLSQIEIQVKNAKARRDYKKVIGLEMQRDKYAELLKKTDFVETLAYSAEEKQSDINLYQWSDYGAFGMANVNFAIKQTKADQIAEMQKRIEEINNYFEKRKDAIKYQISLIENEITLMTRRVREQERIREREELKRQFEESYFDTHESESGDDGLDTTQPPESDNMDTTEPPTFEDDNQN
jgi:TolA-binding protein